MSRQIMRLIIASVTLTALASPSAAYLAKNYEFDNDLSDWTAESGNWVWDGSSGVFGDGSAQVTSVAGSNSLSQCAVFTLVGEDRGLRFIAFARTVDHTSPVRISMELYSSADCSGGAIDTSSIENSSPPLDAWSPVLDLVISVPAGPGINSARVRLTVDSAGGGETTRFDFAALTDSLVRNGDFSDDIDRWFIVDGAWTHVPGDGNTTPLGAAQVTIGGGGRAVLVSCLALNIAPRPSFYFGGGVFKALDTIEPYFMSFQFYSNSDCSPTPPLSAPGLLTDIQQLNTWETFGTSFLAPEGANSMSVSFGTISGTPGSQFMVDSVYLAPPANLIIFRDGFESGDTSEWSVVAP